MQTTSRAKILNQNANFVTRKKKHKKNQDFSEKSLAKSKFELKVLFSRNFKVFARDGVYMLTKNICNMASYILRCEKPIRDSICLIAIP